MVGAVCGGTGTPLDALPAGSANASGPAAAGGMPLGW